jgi:hypothetical protein
MVTETPTIVRRFSVCGPCIPVGELIKRTEKSLIFRNNRGEIKRRGGYRVERGLYHTEPCSSCSDHPRTSYPHGYMD